MTILYKLKSAVGAVALLILLTGFSPSVQASDGLTEDQILDALENTYSGKSFTVNYTQTSTLAALDIVETARGKASFSYPGKMKWEYEAPDNHEVITNGERLWIYRPSENQVMVGSAEQFFKSGAGGAFLSDISLLRKDYDMTILKETATHVDVRLTANRKNPQVSSIIIRLSKGRWIIERVKTYNEYEDTTLFEFYEPEFTRIDPQVFNFRIPENITVLEME